MVYRTQNALISVFKHLKQCFHCFRLSRWSMSLSNYEFYKCIIYDYSIRLPFISLMWGVKPAFMFLYISASIDLFLFYENRNFSSNIYQDLCQRKTRLRDLERYIVLRIQSYKSTAGSFICKTFLEMDVFLRWY